jgi:hypothetical protein
MGGPLAKGVKQNAFLLAAYPKWNTSQYAKITKRPPGFATESVE